MIPAPPVIGRRGAVLVYLGLFDALYALALWRPASRSAQSATMAFLADLAPLSWWAALWFTVGLLCFAGALAHRFDRVSFAAAVAIKTLWGFTFLLGWLAGEIARGWVSAVVWLGLAILVMIIAGWPDSPRSLRRRKS